MIDVSVKRYCTVILVLPTRTYLLTLTHSHTHTHMYALTIIITVLREDRAVCVWGLY